MSKNKKLAFCPTCASRINRSIMSMKQHHLDVHNEILTDGDAYKLVTEISPCGLLSHFK